MRLISRASNVRLYKKKNVMQHVRLRHSDLVPYLCRIVCLRLRARRGHTRGHLGLHSAV